MLQRLPYLTKKFLPFMIGLSCLQADLEAVGSALMAQEGVERAITDAINSGLCTRPADIMLFLRSTLMATRMPAEV